MKNLPFYRMSREYMRRNYQNVFCEQLLWKIMNEVKFIFKLCQLECFRAFIEEIFKLIRNKVMEQELRGSYKIQNEKDIKGNK